MAAPSLLGSARRGKGEVAQSSPPLLPHGLYRPWNSPGQNTGVGLSLLQGIFPAQVSRLVDSLPTEPPGKPKNTGVGSRSLLQWVFPTQGSNQGLLHCRRILYQLSFQGSLRGLQLAGGLHKTHQGILTPTGPFLVGPATLQGEVKGLLLGDILC